VVAPSSDSPPAESAQSRPQPQRQTTANNGHRSRLLERYLKNGIESLHPHEVLELLLTFTISRRDTKTIAKQLLKRFSTISGVCNAPIDELQRVDGIGSKSTGLLRLIRDVFDICLKERFTRRDILSHRNDVEAYLRMTMGYRSDEYVEALFLDAGNHVITSETIAEGTVNQCAIYPRDIIEKALQYKAASFIIAHNHPGGTAAPSEGDWKVTERLFTAGKVLELPLLDHVIICSDRVVSLREMSRWPDGRT
jgi:DNA repair protein RadC